MTCSNKQTKTKFKAHALEHFRHVEETGQTIIVTDHGKPVIEVRPYRKDERTPIEMLRGSVIRFDDPVSLGQPGAAGSVD